MHDAEFGAAMSPPRFTVLRLPLVTFTIGHELLLWQRQNPIVTDPSGFNASPWNTKSKALTQAVLICCRRQPFFVKAWARKCAAQLDLDAEGKWFQTYRGIGSLHLPTVNMPRTVGQPYHYFGGPELARLINYVTRRHPVMIETHFDGSPLNFPLGLAKMLYLVDAECEGGVWIENEHDREVKVEREAFEAKHPENGFAMGEEAVQAMAEKWNAEHPDCPVPLMFNSKSKQGEN